jgi:hypothetical protein
MRVAQPRHESVVGRGSLIGKPNGGRVEDKVVVRATERRQGRADKVTVPILVHV